MPADIRYEAAVSRFPVIGATGLRSWDRRGAPGPSPTPFFLVFSVPHSLALVLSISCLFLSVSSPPTMFLV
ncbi:hypothetical protein D4740_05780 [Actinomyces sp. 2119]|uniref:Uncharacterized protein n=1 Tax=Actinomyces lilanjuaniae TaxID=2321394 RepID=A0ABM6Z4A0_9ACTO|nr:hypothetical protein D5R93_07995 [Actinomyces lilanjuaniae]RJF42462.1 hypothetical protein D4740_05780 [Actinomyces sp. 2119]